MLVIQRHFGHLVFVVVVAFCCGSSFRNVGTLLGPFLSNLAGSASTGACRNVRNMTVAQY